MSKRTIWTAILLLLGLTSAGCGPLTSVACDRVGALCPNVDLAACDATVALVPPRTRSEIVGCTTQAATCTDAVACFTRNQLFLPTY